MEFSVLVVCTANVCRSPAAAALMRSCFDGAGFNVRVASAGTGDGIGFGMDRCPEMIAFMGKRTGVHLPREFSCALTKSVAMEADMVLTADRRQRGRVTALSPRRRDRAFTILEAAALASSPAFEPPRFENPRDIESLRSVVAELDAVRGIGRVPRGEELDLLDPHLDRVTHKSVLLPLVAATRRVVEALVQQVP